MIHSISQYRPFVFSQPALVVGLGGTGLSVARYLAQKNCPFDMADSRVELEPLEALKEEFPDAQLLLGDFTYEQFKQYQQIIVSPGISVRNKLFQTLKQEGHLIIGDIELFAQVVDKPVIAITGSNGKSTVTTLVEKIASESGIKTIAGGNLGIPALDLLATQSDLYVLELSSFQLETTYNLKTLSAIVLNVSEDHMDRYNGLDDYRSVKLSIYKNTDWAIINKDEQKILSFFQQDSGKNTPPMEHPEAQHCIYFGAENPQQGQYGLEKTAQNDQLNYLLKKGDEILLNSSDIRLKGIYNYLNILAAVALLEPLSLDRPKMLQAIKDYAGLEHRCEWVAEINGINYYNDSKGTNAGATIAAINGLQMDIDDSFEDSFKKPQLLLIAGGIGKGADFTQLGQMIKDKVKYLILMGQDAGLIEQSALKAGMDKERIYFVSTMHDAVNQAKHLADNGDDILLSPACASFDMYPNYMARGNDFKTIVVKGMVANEGIANGSIAKKDNKGLSEILTQEDLRDVS